MRGGFGVIRGEVLVNTLAFCNTCGVATVYRRAAVDDSHAGVALLDEAIVAVTSAVGVLACDEGGRRRFWCPDPMRRTCSVTAVTGWETLAACATVTPTPLARHLAVNALSRCAIRSAPLEDARQRGMCGGRRRTDTGTHASGGARLYFLTQDTCEGCPHFTALLTMMLVPPVGELSFASLNRAH